MQELKLEDGSLFRSDHQTDEIDGEGTLITADGTKYQGCFSHGRKEGPFTVTDREGVIECSFHHDIQFSAGTIHYHNGDYYEGRLEDCRPNGAGVLKFRDGIEYRGEFENGLLDGLNCEIHYPNGDVCQGHFSRGVRYMDGSYTKGSERKDSENV